MADYIPSYFLAFHGVATSTTFFAKDNFFSLSFSIVETGNVQEKMLVREKLITRYAYENVCLSVQFNVKE